MGVLFFWKALFTGASSHDILALAFWVFGFPRSIIWTGRGIGGLSCRDMAE
jgi:hypothetical protein